MRDSSLWQSLLLAWLAFALPLPHATQAEDPSPGYTIQQITFGPQHHLFGYIGHAGTIPWNGSERYLLALRFPFQDHLPQLQDAADVLLLDAWDDYRPTKVAETRAWNLQQGTMFYWNPQALDTQFFFNDRDPQSGELFTVLFDITRGPSGERLREYRFDERPLGNSGVAQRGGAFLALNYGRLARLRPVTGYAGCPDWSEQERAPENDGLFRVDVASGKRELLVSYRQLREQVRDLHANIDQYPLFLNHTLWNPESDRISFYLRANYNNSLPRVNVAFTIHADGTNLRRQQYLGGHPEWDDGHVMLGELDGRLVRYHVDRQVIVGSEGPAGTFVDPGGDTALSPDRKWVANGHKDSPAGLSYFTLLSRHEKRTLRSSGIPIGEWTTGDLRIDPAPSWNRSSNQILFGALDGESQTRQLFVLTLQ